MPAPWNGPAVDRNPKGTLGDEPASGMSGTGEVARRLWLLRLGRPPLLGPDSFDARRRIPRMNSRSVRRLAPLENGA